MLRLIALGILGATYGGGRNSRLVLLHDPIQPDLPCPWCRRQTNEDDTACIGCGHHFG